MEQNTVSSRRVVRVSRRKFVITIIVVILLVLGGIAYWMLGQAMRISGPMYDRALPMTSAPGVAEYGTSASPGMVPPQYDAYYPNRGSATVRDTREFLKTNYEGTIKTRDVRDVAKDVRSAVRDASGRIDQSRVSERYAYISFVVPETEFETFRDEIESLTHKKLYTETVNTENLLTQKQVIEEKTNAETNYLQDLRAKKQDLDVKHTARLGAIAKELTGVAGRLAEVRRQIAVTNDPNELNTLRNQEDALLAEDAALKSSRTKENTTYAIESGNLSAWISSSESQIENLRKEDVAFADNIATVNGSVSIGWVSWWEMVRLVSPVHPTILVLIIVLLVLYYLHRKRYIPYIEFV